MTDKVVLRFCHDCSQQLQRHGLVAEDHYRSICAWYAIKRKLFCEAGDEGRGPTMIHFLEQRGYVETTDAGGGMLGVRPIGHNDIVDDGEVVHCYCAGTHPNRCEVLVEVLVDADDAL